MPLSLPPGLSIAHHYTPHHHHQQQQNQQSQQQQQQHEQLPPSLPPPEIRAQAIAEVKELLEKRVKTGWIDEWEEEYQRALERGPVVGQPQQMTDGSGLGMGGSSGTGSILTTGGLFPTVHWVPEDDDDDDEDSEDGEEETQDSTGRNPEKEPEAKPDDDEAGTWIQYYDDSDLLREADQYWIAHPPPLPPIIPPPPPSPPISTEAEPLRSPYRFDGPDDVGAAVLKGMTKSGSTSPPQHSPSPGGGENPLTLTPTRTHSHTPTPPPGPAGIKNDILLRLRSQKSKELDDEMLWNPGLRCWVLRREAWTALTKEVVEAVVKGKEKKGKKEGKKRRKRRRVTMGSEAGGRKGGLAGGGGEGEERVGLGGDLVGVQLSERIQVNPFPPFRVRHGARKGRSLFSDNILTKSITPAYYPAIYSKCIKKGIKPVVPIGLGHMTRALVEGWKKDGEWPPVAGPVEPSFARKKEGAGGATGKGVEEGEGKPGQGFGGRVYQYVRGIGGGGDGAGGSGAGGKEEKGGRFLGML